MTGLLVLAGFVVFLAVLGWCAATGRAADTRDDAFSLAGFFAPRYREPKHAARSAR